MSARLGWGADYAGGYEMALCDGWESQGPVQWYHSHALWWLELGPAAAVAAAAGDVEWMAGHGSLEGFHPSV